MKELNYKSTQLDLIMAIRNIENWADSLKLAVIIEIEKAFKIKCLD